ncbi:lysylphosphatidylglycerol synthase transmembrane domain-containing protein [Candidatus Soleaferrea massiliensis]|uniref:lysylphosphatidylglycerol synthase transmembrane domain-containing protein n=1 Tax=Candidatus Soleaferrea massiliensis TaxID=1470354 RepID=UPI00069409E5|nr:lysylphosphatidylglycerol synthase transmembrane domain-containing protein [Candidatus Soleaferrea massiliensis]
MKKKSNILNFVVCGLALIALLVYMICVDGLDNLLKVAGMIQPLWILLGLLCMVIYWALEAGILHMFIGKLDRKVKFGETLRVSMIGQLFNCVTPFASGGQPIQAYYLTKYGMNLGGAITALLSKFIVYQSVLTLFSAVVLIFKFNSFNSEISGFKFLTLIGFIVNLAVILFLISIAFFEKTLKKASRGIVRFLGKIHILKNPDKTIKHIFKDIEEFHDGMKFMGRNVKTLVFSALLSLVQLTVFFSVAYVVYRSFGLHDPSADMFSLISAQAFVLMISSFMPLPGAVGAAEGSFFLFFSIFFPSNVINFGILVWRLLTFYLPIVVGMLFMSSNRRDLIAPPEVDLLEDAGGPPAA